MANSQTSRIARARPSQETSRIARARRSQAAAIRAQNPAHEFLQFREENARRLCQRFITYAVSPTKSIDWNQVALIDSNNLLVRLLPPNTPWRRFFDILEPTYDELVYEFWSSFEYQRRTNPTKLSVKFRLGGIPFHISLVEFAVKLGIYSEEEVKFPIFLQALRSHPKNISDYWRSIASSNYGKNIYCGAINDPLIRYMHLVLTHTIRGRSINTTRVSATDLLHLYSIFEGVPCNIAHSLACYFKEYQTQKLKILHGGAYITTLAKSYGILTTQVRQGLSPARSPGYVDVPVAQPNTVEPSTTQNPQPPLQPQPIPVPILESHPPHPQTSNISQTLPPSTSVANLPPPPTPSIFQALSPLVSEQGGIMQQSLFDEDMSFQELLGQSSPQIQDPLHHADYSGQQGPSNLGIGPSNVPSTDPPRDPMRVVVAKLIRRDKRRSRNAKMMAEKIKWLEENVQQRFNMDKFTEAPPYNLEPDSDSDLDLDML